MLLVILTVNKLLECFRKKTAKSKSKEFRAIKRKGNKLYVKLKGYSMSFNSWIDKKDII